MPTAHWPLTTMCNVSAGNFWRLRRENDWWLGRYSIPTTLAPACMVLGCLPDLQGPWWGYWGTLTGCFLQGLSACRVLQFLQHHTTGVYLPTIAEHGLPGHMVPYKKCYRDCSRGSADSSLSTSWPCAAEVCLWASLLVHSRNTTLPTRWPRSDTF